MVLVKICGITNAADAMAAAEAGANWLGFNFYPRSPRFIAKADAAKIRTRLPADVEAFGVFVNASPADVLAYHRDVKFHAAQLHGNESPELVAELARALKVIKAFRVDPNFPLATLADYPEVSAFLFDAPSAISAQTKASTVGQYGGAGRKTDWDLARQASAAHRIILAGGLTVENVGEAIREVRPYAVDVASGVETRPGRKDHGRMREFIHEVHRAAAQLNAPEMMASARVGEKP